MRVQRMLLFSGVIALVIAGTALAGNRFDGCTQEEKRLLAAEADQCSGMSYIFNPSACFITRKQLIPYAKGKCQEIARQEGVAPLQPEPVIEKAVEPVAEKKMEPVAEKKSEPVKAAAGAPPALKMQPAETAAPAAAAGVSAVPVSELERLRRDVDALRLEVETLKSEMKSLRQSGSGH